jgi:hypothetical protein
MILLVIVVWLAAAIAVASLILVLALKTDHHCRCPQPQTRWDDTKVFNPGRRPSKWQGWTYKDGGVRVKIRR